MASSGPAHLGEDPQAARWQRYVRDLQQGAVPPFEEQWACYQEVFADRGPDHGPPPAWQPGEEHLRESNLGRFMARLDLSSYARLHRWSVEQPERFWAEVVERLGIVFAREPSSILDPGAGPAQPSWLPGAELNCVDSCFRADPDRVAVVCGSEGRAELTTTTYGELERLVNAVAHGLIDRGFEPGDRIALYMPMTLECVAAYLGIVRAGCAVVSIADSFSATELARRLEISAACGIVTTDTFTRSGKSIDLYAKVIEAAAPRAIVVLSGEGRTELRDGDLAWDELLGSEGTFSSVVGDPYRVTNVIFSSGTTGTPKAIPWTHLTPIKSAMDGHFHLDIRTDDVVAWPTNIGWMMGPWLIYAALVNRAAMALYQGAPNSAGFERFVAAAGVTVLGVVPSLVRAWRGASPEGEADWSRIRVFSSTGEPSSREDYLWLMSRARYRAPVIEYCGGTETGGSYITGTVVQPASPGTFTTAALGLDLVIVDESGTPVAEGEMGEAFLVPPSIGLSQTLLNRDHDEVYYQGCPTGPAGEMLRRHGDQIARLSRGFFASRGRADDTMNLGGIKVSSRELEQVLETHPRVYEGAAVSVQPAGEGAEKLVVFVVPEGEIDENELGRQLGALLASRLNPLFKIHRLVVTDHLPRTASNKLMRRELRSRFLEGAARE
jgi:acetyl-CoA synthetase